MNTKILLILVPLLIFSSTANARRNKNQFDNYGSQQLALHNQGIATRYLIYVNDEIWMILVIKNIY